MHEQIERGASLSISAPLGRFVLDRSGFKPILLIAGGIGITPLLSMLKSHLAREEDAPPLYFIHCCQNRDSQAFRTELDQIAKKHRIPMLYVYGRPLSSDNAGVDYHVEGYLSISHIQEFYYRLLYCARR